MEDNRDSFKHSDHILTDLALGSAEDTGFEPAIIFYTEVKMWRQVAHGNHKVRHDYLKIIDFFTWYIHRN